MPSVSSTYISCIFAYKVLKTALSDVDHVICVSNTCRENLVLRACLHPAFVSTIPNAGNEIFVWYELITIFLNFEFDELYPCYTILFNILI